VLKHTEVSAEITGFVSLVTVTQYFENPFREPVEALYIFPLPDDAAVNEMTLTAGGRVTRATIAKREEARRRYEAAKSEGRRAALLDQERPNIFTQSVANLQPGETVKVSLTYSARVAYDDGEFLFNFPMVVGPRYVPGAPLAGQSQGNGTSPDTARVLDASRITPAALRTGRDIAVTIRLEAGTPVEAMSSASHRLIATTRSPSSAVITLDPADAIPNRDLIFRWKVSGSQRKAAVLSTGSSGGTFGLMLVPPEQPASTEIVPKEMIFVIDTSCSMNGAPLNAAKRAMRSALAQMNPDDTFMLIDFADDASTFHSAPLPNTAQNVSRAIAYLNALPAGGGTNQLVGLEAALTQPADPKRLRMVLLMTDGFIGNEREIFASVQSNLGGARIFGFGVGTSVNHYLLGRMSEIGRGFYQYVRPDEDPEPAIARFVRRIERPLLTDIELSWEGVEVRDVLPRKVPDLFEGQPLTVLGHNLNPGSGSVLVNGRVRGKQVQLRVPVTFAAAGGQAPGLNTLWARARIEELDRQQDQAERSEIIREITTLGLEHHLITAYTSLVAAEDAPVSAPGRVTVDVPTDTPQLTTPSPKRPAAFRSAPTNDGDQDEFSKAFGAPSNEPGVKFSSKHYDVPPEPGAGSELTRETLGQSDILDVVMANRAALKQCVEEQHRRVPGATGKLLLRWIIDVSGRVTSVEVETKELKDTYLAACVTALVKSWSFPSSRRAPDPVVFPFKF
jgi:Ca-activated chloride channel family protein